MEDCVVLVRIPRNECKALAFRTRLGLVGVREVDVSQEEVV